MNDSSGAAPAPLRVAFVPGVTPDKWARTWPERMPGVPLELDAVPESEQTSVLYDGRADMSFVRLPVDDQRLHVIPLYSEVTVVVAPREHFLEAADEVTLSDLAGEHVHPVPPLTVREAVETVAAGVGIVLLPMSVARLHNRKDVVQRPVTDAPKTRIGLAWRRDLEDDRVETFIGIVRGRRATSSRGAGAAPPAPATQKRPGNGRADKGRADKGADKQRRPPRDDDRARRGRRRR